jgi:hypothetical protein
MKVSSWKIMDRNDGISPGISGISPENMGCEWCFGTWLDYDFPFTWEFNRSQLTKKKSEG